MVIELTVEQESKLVDLARNRERTTADLALEALSEYLDVQTEHSEAIKRAQGQVARGETTPHQEVLANLKQRKGW